MCFVCNNYSDQLRNPCQKQVSMYGFLITGFLAGFAEAVFKMADGFFNIFKCSIPKEILRFYKRMYLKEIF